MQKPVQVSGPPRAPLFSGRRVQAYIWQSGLVLAIVLTIWAAANNAATNMRAHGIPTDFSFWNVTAGFNINQTLIPFVAASSTYGDAFFVGLLNTLLVAALGIVFATILGFLIGVARLSQNIFASSLATTYIETIRNVPLLLQLLFWYNAVLKQLPNPRQSFSIFGEVFLNGRGLIFPAPIFGAGAGWIVLALGVGVLASIVIRARARRIQAATGAQSRVLPVILVLVIGLPAIAYFVMGRPISFAPPVLRGFNFSGGVRVLPEFAALTLGLSIYTASFIAEVVRSGLLSVDRGQIEAAHALGLRGSLTLRFIIAPQAMRVIIPPLTNQYLNLMKNSSLAVFIGYPDLVQVFAGTVLNQTGAAVQVIAITMAVYLAISLVTSFGMGVFNKRMALVER